MVRHRFSTTVFPLVQTALLALVVVVASAARSHAGSDPYGLPDEVETALQAALDANYSLRFDEADALLRSLEPHREKHLMIEFGFVLTEWWRLSAAVLEEDKDASRPLLEALDACIAEAEAAIARGDPTGEAQLVHGAALGLLGRWHIANHHWLRSYVVGRKAKASLEKALQINPELYDAYSGIGIYDYFVARLPGIVRFVAFGGGESDPAVGMRMIRLAVNNGHYTVTGTKAALVLVQLRIEKDPAAALDIADELVADHPDSAFFRSLRMIALHDLGRTEALAEEAAMQETLLAEGRFPATRTAQVRFARGLARFVAGDSKAAGIDFEQAVAQADPSDPWGTWARLYLGCLADLRGEREAAKEHYRAVKRMTNRMGTARLAARYLKNEYMRDDEASRMLLPD
jgi:tetratricopeptide (TPR) repeat protein